MNKIIISLTLVSFFSIGIMSAPAHMLEKERIISKNIEIERIAGVDRYDTSLKIAKEISSDSAYIVSGKNFPDALSIGPVAASKGASIVLANDSADFKERLRDIGIKKISIVGGKNSVDRIVEKKLKENFNVERISGKDRYETSLKLIEDNINQDIGIASGSKFPDALTAGAFLGIKNMSLLLVDGANEKNGSNFFNVKYTFGGESTIKESKGKRISGVDRYETAEKISKNLETYDTVILASGKKFPDALSAVPLAKKLNAPILLTDGENLSNSTEKLIRKAKKLVIVGGKSSVSYSVENKFKDDSNSRESNADGKISKVDRSDNNKKIYTDEKVINIEQSHFGVVRLLKKTSNDYMYYLNGRELSPSKVDDEGTIVKFEINPHEVNELSIKSKSEDNLVQISKIGSGTGKFTKIIKKESPRKIITHDSISIEDFVTDTYDKDGEKIYYPKNSTFSLRERDTLIDDKSIPKLSSEKTIYGDDIEISVDKNFKESKEWIKNIKNISIKHGNSKENRANLEYRINENNGNYKIIINANNRVLNAKSGKKNIIIESNGFNNVNHVVETYKIAKDIILDGNYGFYANEPLKFKIDLGGESIQDFIKNVELDGKLLKNNEYNAIFNKLTIKNGGDVGKHQLVVNAEGFRKIELKYENEKSNFKNPEFTSLRKDNNEVNNIKEGTNRQSLKASKRIDVLSSPTKSKSRGNHREKTDVISSATSVVGSRVISFCFDFDMVVNAHILKELNMETDSSKKVLYYWKNTDKKAIFEEDGTGKFIDYTYYKNNAGRYSTSKKYVTFKDLYNSEDCELFIDKPPYVKYILEDGRMGSTLGNGEQEIWKIKAPKLEVDDIIAPGKLIITVSNVNYKEWFGSISKVYINYPNEINKNSIYTDVDNNKLVLDCSKISSLNEGENKIKIISSKYTNAEIKFNYNKSENKNIASKVKIIRDKNNNVILEASEKDYLKKLRLILNGKYLLEDKEVSIFKEGEGDYSNRGDKIVLYNKNISHGDNVNNLEIVLNGNIEEKISFKLNDIDKIKEGSENITDGEKAKGEDLEKKITDKSPEINYELNNNYGRNDIDLRIDREIETDVAKKYINSINKIKLDNNVIKINKKGNRVPIGESLLLESILTIRVDLNRIEKGTHEIRISSDGYEDKIIKFNN
ncbi:cell wall-binding repeat-containing protein [Peptostreptococcus faecalis]|uniref:cell wall-binding repeat-containing protein n=1 Tax=Peptostreptococcus faecalis TaxID=2045015 RepID=UPI000C7D65BC|nr:cell wall-binding repeat-containing protein [Peptostreptococcus faecalis]